MTDPDLQLEADPSRQLQRWLDELAAFGPVIAEPFAMVLATADEHGRPRGRNVLFRGFDERGLVWFTNRMSTKGRHLASNPYASVTFSWLAIRRQVIVAGAVESVTDGESDAYWASRDRGSQLSASASPQSEVVADRATLEAAVVELDRRYPDAVPRPDHWGGYRLRPDMFEFWIGRDSRLHDRFRYERQPDGWLLERLAP